MNKLCHLLWWLYIGWWWYPIKLILSFVLKKGKTTAVGAAMEEKLADAKLRTIKAKKNNVLCAHYTVKGKNPATGRQKEVFVLVERGTSEEEIQEKSGLLPPFEIAENDWRGTPSERQIKYAEDLGFIFPRDAGSDDAHIFLSRAEAHEPLVQPPMPDDLVRYLISKNIHVPDYAGLTAANELYLYGIPYAERYAFFALKVYVNETGKPYLRLENAPPELQSALTKFGTDAEKDSEFVRSFLHYEPNDLSVSSNIKMKKLKAYSVARDFLLREKLI